MPSLNAAQYKKLTDALPGEARSRPPAGSEAQGPQFNDGTDSIRSVPGNTDVAETYTSGDTEEWVVKLETDYLQARVEAKVSGPATTLSQPRLDQLRLEEAAAGKPYLYAKFLAPYTAMPSVEAIGALPAAPPPGVTSYLYDIFCNVKGVPGTVAAGQMFRERTTAANGKSSYTDHWVFYAGYFSPAGADTVTFAPNEGANRPKVLKTFLQGQRALYDAAGPVQALWRYQQAVYTLGSLPKKGTL